MDQTTLINILAKQSKKQFTTELHSESHTIVFDKQQSEPREDNQLFAHIEVGFNPYFRNLVYDYHRKDDNHSQIPF